MGFYFIFCVVSFPYDEKLGVQFLNLPHLFKNLVTNSSIFYTRRNLSYFLKVPTKFPQKDEEGFDLCNTLSFLLIFCQLLQLLKFSLYMTHLYTWFYYCIQIIIFKRYEKESSKSFLIEETSLTSSWSYV